MRAGCLASAAASSLAAPARLQVALLCRTATHPARPRRSLPAASADVVGSPLPASPTLMPALCPRPRMLHHAW